LAAYARLTFGEKAEEKNMSKDEMIRKLVSHSVKTALSESKHYWLSDLFEKGFGGYRSMSRGQLLAELQMRGLSEDGEKGDAYASDDLDDLDDLDFDDLDDASLDLPMRAGAAD
jgi:hypothetical protein